MRHLEAECSFEIESESRVHLVVCARPIDVTERRPDACILLGEFFGRKRCMCFDETDMCIDVSNRMKPLLRVVQ